LETFQPSVAPRRGLWETILEPLRRAIILAELPPGMRLDEASLAQKFGVSRIPVREAFVRLEVEGMVRIEPRRGAFVVGFGEEDIADIYECRRVIECHAIRRAAERVDEQGLARLWPLVESMDAATRRNRADLLAVPDVEFHRQLVALAGNRRLVAAWAPIAGLVGAILAITDAANPDSPASVESHRAMVEALARRDPDAAESLLRDHLVFGERVMRATLRTSGRSLSAPASAEAAG
jgi:DNA-binding GntR family transcriptional regulator